jgi:hypothetical protein
MSMKNSNDTIGNRFRVLPVCSAVPQTQAREKIYIYDVDLIKTGHLVQFQVHLTVFCVCCVLLAVGDFPSDKSLQRIILNLLEFCGCDVRLQLDFVKYVEWI